MEPQITTIDVIQLASGDNLSIQVYKFIGSQPGKKSYIQANLHGCEIVGNQVIYELINFLFDLDKKQLVGEIWLVPLCNPLATNERTHFFSTGRFNPYNGQDWNRIFWDYEKECNDLGNFVASQLTLETELVQKNFLEKILTAFQQQLERIKAPSSVPYSERYRYHLQSLCLDANYVIDIHSSSNQAIDYLYCFSGREESAKYFLLESGILMNEYDGDAFDEAFLKPWLAVEKQFAQVGQTVAFDVESWTLELGSGLVIEPDSVTKGVRGIINYLTYKKVLSLNEVEQTAIKLVQKSAIKKYYASVGGMIQNRVELGTKVQKGDLLYQVLSFPASNELPHKISVHAENNGLVFDLATNQAVNQGEYVLSIMSD
ncbi:MAG: succinylglutamate desuccinylase/aspartoacylase family protein [Spirulinaceae cyanobacterium]